jgi:MipA family protein
MGFRGRGGYGMIAASWRCAFAAFLILAPGFAAAADLPAPALPAAPAAYAPPVPDWIVTVGIEGRIVPEWPGAKDSKFGLAVLPLFSIRKEGTPPEFFGPRDSFGFNIIDLGQFQFGPALQFIGDRQAQNYRELYGLGSVGYTAQVGAFANFWPLPWLRLRGEVRQGIGGETGVTGDLFLDAVAPIGQWTLSGGPRMTLQSTAAVSPYFTITPAQSLGTAITASSSGLPPLPAYNATGGVYSYGAGGQVQYRFSPQWELHTFVEYQRLTGSVANSPIVTVRGSANQFTYGLGGTYAFDMHPWW